MELPFVGSNGVVKMSKIRVRFLWYHICFKSMRRWLMIYMMIAYVIYGVGLCHTWCWLVSYMVLAYALLDDELSLTCCSKEPYVTFN